MSGAGLAGIVPKLTIWVPGTGVDTSSPSVLISQIPLPWEIHVQLWIVMGGISSVSAGTCPCRIFTLAIKPTSNSLFLYHKKYNFLYPSLAYYNSSFEPPFCHVLLGFPGFPWGNICIPGGFNVPGHVWGSLRFLLTSLVTGPPSLPSISPVPEALCSPSVLCFLSTHACTGSCYCLHPTVGPRPLYLAVFPPLGFGPSLLGVTWAKRPSMPLLSDSTKGCGAFQAVVLGWGCRTLLIRTHQHLWPIASFWSSFSSHSRGTLLRLGYLSTGYSPKSII